MSETYPPAEATAPAPAPAPRRRSAGRIAALTIGLMLVLAVPVAAFVVLGVLHGAGDQQDKMVPANVDFYAAVYLDPGVSQKLNVATIAHRFPDTRTDADIDQQITRALNDAFKDSGLDYGKDVKPWLGNQASVAVRVEIPDPRAVVMVATRDDKATQAAIEKAKKHDTTGTWHQATHNGVTLTTNSDTSKGGPTSYAIFNHTLLVANSESFSNDVIDTNKDPKNHAALHDNADYRAAMSKLPSERLAVAYANAPTLLARLKDQLKKDSTTASLLSGGQFDGLDAFRGVGIALAAHSDGVLLQVEVGVDRSKLTDAARASLAASGHASTVLKYIPTEAYGAFAFGGGKDYGAQLKKLVDAAPPDSKSFLQGVGLTDPNGIFQHLTGDAGIDVEPGSSPAIPAGSLLVGTNDGAVARQFLDKIAALVAAFVGVGSPVSSNFTQIDGSLSPQPGSAGVSRPHFAPSPSLKRQSETYKGVVITSLVLPAGSFAPAGVEPAWAVEGTGMIIISTSPTELKRLLETHAGGSNISTSAGYRDAVGDAGSSASSVFYVDIQGVLSAIRAALPSGSSRSDFDKQAGRFDAVKSVGLSANTGSDHVSERVFVVIK